MSFIFFILSNDYIVSSLPYLGAFIFLYIILVCIHLIFKNFSLEKVLELFCQRCLFICLSSYTPTPSKGRYCHFLNHLPAASEGPALTFVPMLNVISVPCRVTLCDGWKMSFCLNFQFLLLVRVSVLFICIDLLL